MLKFLIVFFCLLIGIFSANVYHGIISYELSLYQSEANIYVDSIFQRQLYSVKYCMANKCDQEILNSPNGIIPPSIANGAMQKKIFVCYQSLDRGHSFILLTGYKDYFLKNDIGASKIKDVINSIVYALSIYNSKTNIPFSIYYNRDKLFSSIQDDIKSCVKKYNNSADIFSVYLVSQI